MTPWLAVVGLGEDGLDGLSAAARRLVEEAEVLVGGERHLAMLPADDGRERLAWPSPLTALVGEIEARRGQRVCVLATGDPLWYGVGVTLARRIAREEMVVVPHLSAFSLACARLGWPLAEVECLTLHGRPVALLQAFVQPGARLLALADSRETPGAVAALLAARGYGGSRIRVLEHMGGPQERIMESTAGAWSEAELADFNTIAVDCIADPGARLLSRSPGLPDDAYRHDGQLTKREVRAAALARLAPAPGQLLWDVGAGCGSVAIEWMRAARGARAVAVEKSPERADLIAANAAALGTPGLLLVRDEAPDCLASLEAPDAVFLGGGLGAPGLLGACWEALRPGGRFVANAVTLESEVQLIDWQARLGGELIRLSVARAEPVGKFQGWKPLMPVIQLTTVKP